MLSEDGEYVPETKKRKVLYIYAHFVIFVSCIKLCITLYPTIF